MGDELNKANYKRIYKINWLICGPLLLLFAWPYLLLAEMIQVPDLLGLTGSIFFSIPFTLTVLHGHISVAVGSLHRTRYYNWQTNLPGIFKYPFHPVLFRTRIRLAIIGVSLTILFIGFLYK
jgi:TRAP-type mannitol/chloroaromatic compound transport system permease small subunit